MLDSLNVAGRYAAVLGPMLIFGASLMQCMAGRTDGRVIGRRTLALLSLLASVLLLAVQTALITGAAVDAGSLWQVATLTSYGHAWAVKTLALLLLSLALFGRCRAWVVIALSGLALAATAVSGHAAGSAGALGLLHEITNVLHVWCAAFWVGALLVVLPLLTRWGENRREAGPALMKFSRYGHWAVAGTLLTGAINTWLILRDSGLDVKAPYQQWLGLKILLALVMAGLALNNRYGLVPQGIAALPRLRRQTQAALVAGLLAILAVALLGTLSPGG